MGEKGWGLSAPQRAEPAVQMELRLTFAQIIKPHGFWCVHKGTKAPVCTATVPAPFLHPGEQILHVVLLVVTTAGSKSWCSAAVYTRGSTRALAPATSHTVDAPARPWRQHHHLPPDAVRRLVQHGLHGLVVHRLVGPVRRAPVCCVPEAPVLAGAVVDRVVVLQAVPADGRAHRGVGA